MEIFNLIIITIISVIIESFAISLFKFKEYFYIAIALYSFTGYALGSLIQHSGLVIGHALYDIISILTISLIGVFYFKEVLSMKQWIGLLFGFIAIYLLEYAD